MVAALEGLLVVADHAEGHIQAQPHMPFIVHGADIVGKGHLCIGSDITLVGTGSQVTLGAVNIRLRPDSRHTTADLGALQAGHAGGVAEYGAGILRRRGTTGKRSTHATDALFVHCQAVCHDMAGGPGNSDCDEGLEPGVFDHRRCSYLFLTEARSYQERIFDATLEGRKTG